MKTEQLLFKILASVSALLVAATVAVAIPLALRGDAGSSSSGTGGGDTSLYEYRVIYGPYGRSTPAVGADGTRDYSKNIKSVTVFTGTDTYSLVHPQTNGRDDYLSFVLSRGGTVLSDITVGNEAAAEMIASFGSLFARLVTRENLPDRYAEYGLADTESLPYFELTLYGKTLTETGDTLRVYIGKRAADGGGHYFRIEGESAIYVSQTPTAGTLVSSGIEYFVSPILVPTLPETNYHLAESFRVSGETAVRDGRTVGGGDTVLVEETVRVVTRKDGSVLSDETVHSLSRRYTLSSATLSADLRSALVGRPVGERRDETVTVRTEVPSLSGGTVTREETHTIHAVTAVMVKETRVGIEFLYRYADRDEFYSAGLYRLTAPTEITLYPAGESVIKSVLSSLSSLKGIKTYQYGFTDEDILSLGLTHAVTLSVPKSFTETEINGSISSIEAKDFTIEGTESFTLYVSDPLPDGTRYVASTYSEIIATVDASAFDFVDYESYDWVNRSLVLAFLDIVETLTFTLNFTDTTDEYVVYQNAAEKTGSVYTKIPVTLNGERHVLSYEEWQNLYLHLAFRSYSGNAELSSDALQGILSHEPVLSMTFLLRDGRTYTYEMRPVSDRRALVTLVYRDGNGTETENSGFFLSTSVVKGIAEKLRIFVSDGVCTPDGIYGEKN